MVVKAETRWKALGMRVEGTRRVAQQEQELGTEVYTLRRDEGLGMSMSIVQEV